jgi:hypothetical protein
MRPSCIELRHTPEQASLPLDERRVQLLVFVSGYFTGPNARWSTADKDAFPVWEVNRKWDYLLLGE